ncbi:folylpolyglutamate synthase/dihydrofolate synthase family protein [Oceanithermus sp.]|uniref:bifunctional folylpolyglutamate synthase/dihydrofolate synthase n=1 Tax=Oceanithermus sp. TaxID=2268145 RepID=UPI00257D32BE|nr:folylpolyglutamate synthase/dihydrofolate synthase family protein [Oceanithermus sp.]
MSRTLLERLARRGMTPGLERIRALIARLDHPERAFRVVLVGGTNGKGSTARALARVLQAAGERVGLFTSPHLLDVRERIEVDGAAIAPEALDDLLARLAPHLEASGASYFEALAAAALVHFAEQNVTTAVLEVGLGGRFDAVNAVEPALSIVTNVDLDHTDWLGPTLAHVAREKAGILRSGRPALTAATGAGAAFLAAAARARGARLERVAPTHVETHGYGVAFVQDGGAYAAPLMGRHQAVNLALAVRAARLLGAGEAAVRAGLAAVRHPGRLEYRPAERLLLDGAHNPAGAKALVRALADYFPLAPKTLVFAASGDKDVAAMAAALRPAFARVWLTRYPDPRAAAPALLRQHFPEARVEPNPQRALARAREERPPGGLVVVAGSLYLLAALARTASEAGAQ